MPIYADPVDWTNQTLVLFHGTTERYAEGIVKGIDISGARTDTDFGKAFYTTTWKEQAVVWAKRVARYYRGEQPFLVAFVVERDSLSTLRTLSFARGTDDAEDFWSLIHHCRNNSGHHNVAVHDWYDVVSGPVAALPVSKRWTLPNHDQFSFHTADATSVLDHSKKSIEHVG